MLVGIYNPPALVTLTGLVCGVCACLLAIQGKPELAISALIWAGIFDLLDGVIARRTLMSDRESAFGIQIDSLVDMVSFGITPVIIAVNFGLSGFIGLIAAVLYTCAAAQRLAFFNILQEESKTGQSFYTGLPVTFSALIFGIAFSTKTLMTEESFNQFLTLIFLLVAFLFVFPAKIPKPSGKVYIIMPILAIFFTIYWVVKFYG